jgi:hypothetical protein
MFAKTWPEQEKMRWAARAIDQMMGANGQGLPWVVTLILSCQTIINARHMKQAIKNAKEWLRARRPYAGQRKRRFWGDFIIDNVFIILCLLLIEAIGRLRPIMGSKVTYVAAGRAFIGRLRFVPLRAGWFLRAFGPPSGFF